MCKNQVDTYRAENDRVVGEKNAYENKIKELNKRLDEYSSYIEELKQRVSEGIIKNNENCIKFENDNKIIQSLGLVLKNSTDALIEPFLK